jgi:molybdopterin converting factor small subunit
MRLKIRFFASIKDKIGKEELIIDREDEGIPLCKLVNDLRNKYPVIPENILIAVNHEYRDPNYIVKDKDEIALITPVSGG